MSDSSHCAATKVRRNLLSSNSRSFRTKRTITGQKSADSHTGTISTPFALTNCACSNTLVTNPTGGWKKPLLRLPQSTVKVSTATESLHKNREQNGLNRNVVRLAKRSRQKGPKLWLNMPKSLLESLYSEESKFLPRSSTTMISVEVRGIQTQESVIPDNDSPLVSKAIPRARSSRNVLDSPRSSSHRGCCILFDTSSTPPLNSVTPTNISPASDTRSLASRSLTVPSTLMRAPLRLRKLSVQKSSSAWHWLSSPVHPFRPNFWTRPASVPHWTYQRQTL